MRERFEERGHILPRIGKAPKRAIPFRTAVPFAKITANLIAADGSTGEKIEFLCAGQQVVVAGIHPGTGKPYSWPLGNPTDVARNDLPEISEAEAQQLVEDIVDLLCRDFGYTRAPTRSAPKSNGVRPANPAEDWQQLVDDILAGNELHANTRDLAAKMVRSGMDGGAIVNFLRALMNSSAAARDQRWQDRYDNLPRLVGSWQEKLENEQAAQAQPAQNAASPAAQPAPSAAPIAASGSGSSGPPPSPPPGMGTGAGAGPAPAAPSAAQATRQYMKGKSTWACNVANVLLALKQDPALVGAFGFDKMLMCEVVLRPLFGPDPDFVVRAASDGDVTGVQAHLQWQGFRRLGKDATHDAVAKFARENGFHPLRNYLNALVWDGVERLPMWLVKAFGAKQNEYAEQIGTMFLIAMVARVIRPGCKVDYMLVLEGEQGEMKSSACNILAGGYFSDQLPDITSKEAFQHLRGKWLIEVAELRAYSRAAVDHFKEFLVREVEQYRPPWGRKDVYEPRQCCFIGTTNKTLYLRDETGNRRFWPIKTGKIDLDWLRQNRDQMFAEALVLYRKGVHWWPDRDFERQTIRAEQESRYEGDIWEEPIRLFLDGLAVKKTTLFEVALGALHYEKEPPSANSYQPNPPRGTPINRCGPREQQRIAAVLTHLKWGPQRDKHTRRWEPL